MSQALYEIKLFQPGSDGLWVADAYLTSVRGGSQRIHCGTAWSNMAEALGEAADAVEHDRELRAARTAAT